MKDLVGQSDEVCQKLHVKENDLKYLKKGRLGMLCRVKICLKIVKLGAKTLIIFSMI